MSRVALCVTQAQRSCVVCNAIRAVRAHHCLWPCVSTADSSVSMCLKQTQAHNTTSTTTPQRYCTEARNYVPELEPDPDPELELELEHDPNSEPEVSVSQRWEGARGRMQLERCTWEGAAGRVHLDGCSWEMSHFSKHILIRHKARAIIACRGKNARLCSFDYCNV